MMSELANEMSRATPLRKAILEGIGASYLFSLGGLLFRRGEGSLATPLVVAVFLFVVPFAGIAWGLGWHGTHRLRLRTDWKRHLGHVDRCMPA